MQHPRHIAIIMDGNGRWASARGWARAEGHRKGADAALNLVQTAKDNRIQYVTLFGFSSENWKRPIVEIESLMSLLRLYLKKEMAELHRSGVRLLIIGNRSRLPEDIVRLIESAEMLTQDNKDITVIIALSYGGREDIAFAAREIARRAKQGTLDPEGLTETDFFPFLMTAGIPDPDLVIRTGGEHRLSNFLLWQSAYSEIYFSDVLWPDFSALDLQSAIAFYQSRERRYGGLSEQEEKRV